MTCDCVCADRCSPFRQAIREELEIPEPACPQLAVALVHVNPASREAIPCPF